MILFLFYQNILNMRTTNSRDKGSRPDTTENNKARLLKTSGSTRANQEKQQTMYNRPSSGKKIQSDKNIPPKVIKKQYNIDDMMTESKIFEAKKGLQLLKKKTSTKGMSRQKINSMNRIAEQKPSLKSIPSQKNQPKYENKNSNIPQKINKMQSQYQQPIKKTTPKIPMKKTTSEQVKIQKKPIPKQQYYQQYKNPQEEVPIAQKKNFDAMLEEQLRKEAKKQSATQAYQNYDDEEPGDVELVECSEGCGRMFSTQVIEKHEKICQKVFQSKRKAFDSASRRAPQIQGFDKPPAKKTMAMTKKPKEEKKQTKAMPKWKAESLAFRASMKAAQGVALTKEQKQATQSNLVQCDYCGRKFNQTAAARHIPFCETKSKQMPKKRK